MYSDTLHEEMDEAVTCIDGKYERFAQVEQCVREQIKLLLSGGKFVFNIWLYDLYLHLLIVS